MVDPQNYHVVPSLDLDVTSFAGPSSSRLTATVLEPMPDIAIANRAPPTSSQSHDKASFLRIVDPLLQIHMDTYFSRIYPLCPIVNPTKVKTRFSAGYHYQDRGFAAHVLALTSLALILPDSPTGSEERADAFMTHCTELHNTAQLGTSPSLETIATSMSIAAFSRARHGADAAFLRTKESIGLTELLRLHRPEAHAALSDDDKEIALNIFRILSVAER